MTKTVEKCNPLQRRKSLCHLGHGGSGTCKGMPYGMSDGVGHDTISRSPLLLNLVKNEWRLRGSSQRECRITSWIILETSSHSFKESECNSLKKYN